MWNGRDPSVTRSTKVSCLTITAEVRRHLLSPFFFGKYENKATSGRIGGQRTRSASKLARRMRTTGSLLSARRALVVLEEMGQTRRMEMEAPTVGRSQPR